MDDRRDFLKMGLVAMGMAGLPLAASAETGAKVPLTNPKKVTVIDNQENQDGDRTETRTKVEVTGGNGAVHRFETYHLRIEREDSYDVTTVMRVDKYASALDKSPADSELRITIIQGDKGEIEGDYRNDEVKVTVFGPEGMQRMPLQNLKKPLVEPYAGLSLQDKAQAIFDDQQRRRNPAS